MSDITCNSFLCIQSKLPVNVHMCGVVSLQVITCLTSPILPFVADYRNSETLESMTE